MINRWPYLLILILGCLLIAVQRVNAQALSVQSAVEKTDVYVGEAFAFQIQLSGHDAPDQPDLSALQDFKVETRGGQQNSSSSVTIINGRMTQQVNRGYIFSYQLTPKKTGVLTIPAIAVTVAGQTLTTQPLRIRAQKPVETNDFKLRMTLSTTQAYVGEPVGLTLTWYIGMDVAQFLFNLPVVDDKRFRVLVRDMEVDPLQREQYLRIPIGDREAIGKRGRELYKGREYLTVNLELVLFPHEAGILAIPQTTVAFNAVVKAPQRSRRRSVFDMFGDDVFGSSKQYKKFVIPSNEPTLTVKSLPHKGRPQGFNGLVGKYQIMAAANPLEVNVGDPITLTIGISGPDYLDNVKPVALDQQAKLAKDFKIPKEMGAGKVAGNVINFTQTIRAKSADVKTIPSIELPYFDTGTESYVIVRTDPIPLKVNATRIVTAEDAWGKMQPTIQAKSELETWGEGIAHNYDDDTVLENQLVDLRQGLFAGKWLFWIIVPPAIYFFLFSVTFTMRRRHADPQKRRAQRAFAELMKTFSKLKHDIHKLQPIEVYTLVLETFRCYLGDKMQLASEALTYADIANPLQNKNINEETLARLQALFEAVEAIRFAGAAVTEDRSLAFVETATQLAKDLDRSLS